MDFAMDPSILSEVESLVSSFRSMDNGELEVRFGVWSGGRFLSSVPLEFWNRMTKVLQEEGGIPCTDLEEFHDAFFSIGTGPSKTRVRTRVHYDTDEFLTRCEYCVKRKVKEVVVSTNRTDGIAFKICLNSETMVPRTGLPDAVSTEHFRIIQRRTFLYGPPDGAPNWAYDFSFQWHGDNKTAADTSQHSGPPRYEMEIEMVNRDYLARNSDRYIADSALCKAMDFINRSGPSSLTVSLATPVEHSAGKSSLVDVTPGFMLISDH